MDSVVSQPRRWRFRAARLDGGWINSRKGLYAVLIGLFVVGGLAPAVMAQVPTPTAAGITDGFTLTTFATTNPGNTGCCGGPFGVAVASSGNIIIGTGSGSRYLFADTDGQTVGSALFTQTNSSFTQAYARAGGQAYGVDGQRHFVQFDPNGENELASQTLKGRSKSFVSPCRGIWSARA